MEVMGSTCNRRLRSADVCEGKPVSDNGIKG